MPVLPHKELTLAKAPDQRFSAWLIARNAHTLRTQPSRLFEAEACFPARNSLVYGEPMITLGIVGIPSSLVSGDPLVVFNTVLIAIVVISAFAMYLLIVEWTGEPAAAIAAALVYAFHATKLGDPVHPYLDDTAWLVFALYFSRRLFAGGRWLDVAGLSLSVALLLGGSFYPFVSAVALAIPYAIWLFWSYRLRHASALQLGVVMASGLFAGWLVFAPYLDTLAADSVARQEQYFAAWADLLPGRAAFPGLLVLGLALAALVQRRDRVLRIDGDPRWAVLIGGALAIVLATGGNTGDVLQGMSSGDPVGFTLPSLYHALAPYVPGLDRVRAPGRMDAGLYVSLSILSGLGAASLLRRAPQRWALYAGAALVVLAFAQVRGPSLIGSSGRYELQQLAPSERMIAFFQKLEALGDTGPLVEAPFAENLAINADRASQQMLLTAYHHRPTSECRTSFVPTAVRRVRELIAELPHARVIDELRALGFTTLIVHHHPSIPRHRDIISPYLRAAAGPGARLRRLHGDEAMTAFVLLP
jgi:hypothetical protein